MDLNEYQSEAMKTARYRFAGGGSLHGIVYCALGLGEAGEVQGKLKKVLRGDRPLEDAKADIAAELGDTLWYVSTMASELGYTLDQIANMNLEKLASRKERNVLQGDGDHR